MRCGGEAMGARMTDCVTFSTEALPPRQRCEWLREIIGREYANVEITPPADGLLFNEMKIYPWKDLRLSAIRSNAITIERSPKEPAKNSHDAYFAVVLLSGSYLLEQNGREAVLKPGDVTIYDATRSHRIICPSSFTKLIVSIPRPLLRSKVPGIEHATALRIPGNTGIGSVTGNFIRSCAIHAAELSLHDFSALADPCAELLTLTLASMRPEAVSSSRNRAILLLRIKDFIEQNLGDPGLNAAMVARGAGLSPRYINDIFKDENTSLMRHVWGRRLERCRRELMSQTASSQRVSDIAFRWGFNDLSHFSRAFKQRFGHAPRDYRQHKSGETA